MYRIVKSFPDDEKYGLTSQIKRVSTSIPLNIAEGYGKKSSSVEFKRFLSMAKGSANEMVVLLNLSKDLGFINEQRHQEYVLKYDEIGKMLSGLIDK